MAIDVFFLAFGDSFRYFALCNGAYLLIVHAVRYLLKALDERMCQRKAFDKLELHHELPYPGLHGAGPAMTVSGRDIEYVECEQLTI